MKYIALSANAMLHNIEEGQEAGFFRYLTKSIRINTRWMVRQPCRRCAETVNDSYRFKSRNNRSQKTDPVDTIERGLAESIGRCFTVSLVLSLKQSSNDSQTGLCHKQLNARGLSRVAVGGLRRRFATLATVSGRPENPGESGRRFI